MSYQTWSNQGYGIIVKDEVEIETTTDKIWNLIHQAPNFEKYVFKWAEDLAGSKDFKKIITVEDFVDEFYDEIDNYCGLATILANVMTEVIGIYFYSCDDFDGNQYILHPNAQPWELSEKERSTTLETMDFYFKKFYGFLSDTEIEPDYYSAENGG